MKTLNQFIKVILIINGFCSQYIEYIKVWFFFIVGFIAGVGVTAFLGMIAHQ